MSLRILAFGEILWDVIEGVPHIGGAPLNFCGHAARMGARSAIVSALGKDDLGSRALGHLEALGVDDSFVASVDAPTGTVLVELEEGIPSYDIKEGSAWDNIRLSPEQREQLEGQEWDLIYIGSLAQRTEGNRKLLKELLAGLTYTHVFYDVNLRLDYYSKEILEDSLRSCTIAKLNDEEVEEISLLLTGSVLTPREFAPILRRDYGVELICVTLGKEGALFFTGQAEALQLSPGKVKVADTVGAGDSFSAGLVYGYLSTGDPRRAGQLALDVADFVVSHAGALPEYSAELKSRIKRVTEKS